METGDAAPVQDTHADGENSNNNNAQASELQAAAAATAPVVPGPRAIRFQELYAQSLKRTLGKLKWDNFAACYPTVAKKAEPVLKQVQTQMAEKLADKCEVWMGLGDRWWWGLERHKRERETNSLLTDHIQSLERIRKYPHREASRAETQRPRKPRRRRHPPTHIISARRS